MLLTYFPSSQDFYDFSSEEKNWVKEGRRRIRTRRRHHERQAYCVYLLKMIKIVMVIQPHFQVCWLSVSTTNKHRQQ